MKDFWDKRYSGTGYAYGILPNSYFKLQIDKLQPGKILLPSEGEGRNAVYAAKLGWHVHALDFSENGREKALQLANENDVSLNYEVGSMQDIQLQENEYDAISLIYAHFPPQLRCKIHEKLIKSLKPNGLLIMEAFSKKQLGKESGGPQVLEMLYSLDEIKSDFAGLEFIEGEEQQIELTEGKFHSGLAEVVRFLARKTN